MKNNNTTDMRKIIAIRNFWQSLQAKKVCFVNDTKFT